KKSTSDDLSLSLAPSFFDASKILLQVSLENSFPDNSPGCNPPPPKILLPGFPYLFRAYE
ncbi:hypothetical protein MLH65_018980, partial [Escherichia coli]|nr:hypothetical protein [Escherichia coli]MCN5159589.1 hypothetical protein [Escherichia coli]MCN6197375.1 hypothetical protein [Escherichia coli]MCN7405862.1 hypothetical protein [Escherichia coli]MCN7695244.1 hypothetical protein [Escherichia coli]